MEVDIPNSALAYSAARKLRPTIYTYTIVCMILVLISGQSMLVCVHATVQLET